MLVEPDSVTPERIFNDTKEARKELTPNECEWFVQKHIEFQTEEARTWGIGNQDPYLMQIAAGLGFTEDFEPQAVVEAVSELVG